MSILWNSINKKKDELLIHVNNIHEFQKQYDSFFYTGIVNAITIYMALSYDL